MKSLPRLNKALVAERVGEEMVILCTGVGEAYCLNPVAKLVYQSCEARESLEQCERLVASSFAMDAQEATTVVEAALFEMRAHHLFEADESASSGEKTRREVLVASLKIAPLLPFVSSALLPSPAMAISCRKLGQTTTQASDCCGSFVGSQVFGTTGGVCCKNSPPTYSGGIYPNTVNTDADCRTAVSGTGCCQGAGVIICCPTGTAYAGDCRKQNGQALSPFRAGTEGPAPINTIRSGTAGSTECCSDRIQQMGPADPGSNWVCIA
ncbi:MAG: PqqD family protein [Candidatus Eremiobacteraeota bacterium]|nr:PqqD family protein [Candidatus Eremiobacteraeota bacterium]